MAEFQTLQDSVVPLLMCMESQVSRLERVESETKDEKQVEEKDQEPRTKRSTSPPLGPMLPLTSYSLPPIVVGSVSSLVFNLPPHIPPISEKSPLSSPLSVFDEKCKMRTEAPPTISYTADFPHPSAATMGTIATTSSGAPLGIGQLKLEGPARYFGG